MNREHFAQSLANDQFNEVVEKSLSANEHNAAHSHQFAVRALVTQGDITLTVDGVQTRYGEGEIFAMVAGCKHAEDVGAAGVTYVAGRRYVSPSIT